MRRYFLLSRFLVIAGYASLVSCSPGSGGSIAAPFADADADGWFDGANNLMTVLTLATVAVNGNANAHWRVIVDGVRFPNGPTIPLDDTDPGDWFAYNAVGGANENLAVAKRIQAMNHYNQSLDPGHSVYNSTVKVEQLGGGGPIDYGTTNLRWISDGGETLTLTFGGGAYPTVTLTFTTATSRFSDPTPGNATGDADGDGILENEEAAMVARTNGLGDPQPGGTDIMVVVGKSEPTASLDPSTYELLKTRFFSRAINLHIDSGVVNGRPGIGGGPMALGGTPVVPGTVISMAQTLSIRNANLPAAPRRSTHFVLLAAGIDVGGFGLTNATPGSHTVMKANLAPLPTNIFNYQAGVFMHELGHQLGLCHPTDQTGMPDASGALCGTIPVAERDPGATAMGSPAEDRGMPIAQAVNALRRPIDYTPGQWALINPVGGMIP
jgi:hypothetical protein